MLGAALAWPFAGAFAMMPGVSSLAPAGAVALTERGSWDLAVANAVAALSQALQRGHAPLSFQRWRLPGEADLAQVQTQLAQALGDDWEPASAVPRQGVGAQLRGWLRKSPAGETQAFGLAWLDELAKVDGGPAVRIAVTAAPRG
jgi:hypothetical protein